MTIREFVAKYYLHDSSIERIVYDEKNKKLTLTIEFCFWAQNWYDETTPSNGKISVVFKNVSTFNYDENLSEKIFADELDNEILETKLEQNGLIFNLRETVSYQPIREIFCEIEISADNVEVEELERYSL